MAAVNTSHEEELLMQSQRNSEIKELMSEKIYEVTESDRLDRELPINFYDFHPKLIHPFDNCK